MSLKHCNGAVIKPLISKVSLGTSPAKEPFDWLLCDITKRVGDIE